MQDTPYTLPTLLSGLIAVGTAFVAWRRRKRTPTAQDFVGVAASFAIMCLAYAGELASATLEAKLAWLDVRWVGLCSGPSLGLLLALRWAGHERWVTRGRLAALGAIPVLTLLFAWTNDLHGLVAGPSYLVPRNGYVLRSADGHAWFWVYVAHAYACLLAVLIVYARKVISSPPHRRQGVLLLVSTLSPLAANVVYVFFGETVDRGYDMSHVGYGIACVAWTFALSRGQLFDVVPVARDGVIDSLGDAFLVVDGEARVLDHNPAAARLFDRPSFVGASLPELVGEALSSTLLSDRTASLLGRVYEIDRSVVRHSRGASAWVLILRDITDRRRLEAAREEARRAAEEAGRARAQFLARMSHEVRSPLHGVVGAAELLLSSELEAKPRRYAEAVATSARVLLALVDELLDFSKLDADRLNVDLADVEAREIIEETALLFAGAAEKKGLRLTVQAPPKVPVRADRVRLRQVLVNLVGNAVKFTDAGGITIAVERTGSEQRISVRDTGIGIAESAHEQIFEPFVQVRAAPREGPAGTGLGLSIARRMTELMGGRLGVESAVGRGSTFWLTLPAREEAGREARAPVRSGGGRRTGRVLVVEDDEVNQLVTRGLLEREGCDVEVVGSGPEALERVSEERFALLLTDVRMPGMTGHELTVALRAREQGARLVVVALTADVHETARQQALESGLDDWLAKPVDPVQLRRVLDRWVPRDALEAEPTDLKGYFAADPALFARLAEAFRRSAPVDAAAVREAEAQGREEAARDRAHALKGAAMLLGASELAATCDCISRGAGEDRSRAVAALDTDVARALAALPAHQQRSA